MTESIAETASARPGLRAWVLAARPKTLSAAIAPVLVGGAMAWHDTGRLSVALFACTLLGSILIQIGTNFVNDAIDFRKGTDTAERIGPLRVTQAGLLTDRAVLVGAAICFLLAAACGVPLILHAGWPLLAIGVASIVAAYAYTAGPYPLAYNGLGEIFVIAFFGFAAVGGTFFVQTRSMRLGVLAYGLALGLLSTALLAVNNLRDRHHDERSGKRTMAVRFGDAFARAEVAFCATAPIAIAAAVALRNRDWSLAAPVLAILPALALIGRVRDSEGRELNASLGIAGALLWLFGILGAAGYLLSRFL